MKCPSFPEKKQIRAAWAWVPCSASPALASNSLGARKPGNFPAGKKVAAKGKRCCCGGGFSALKYVVNTMLGIDHLEIPTKSEG